jgi:hypothetical protein
MAFTKPMDSEDFDFTEIFLIYFTILTNATYELVYLVGNSADLNLVLHQFLPNLGNILTKLVEF